MRAFEIVGEDFPVRSSSAILDACTEPVFRGGLEVGCVILLINLNLNGTFSAALSTDTIVYPRHVSPSNIFLFFSFFGNVVVALISVYQDARHFGVLPGVCFLVLLPHLLHLSH